MFSKSLSSNALYACGGRRQRTGAVSAAPRHRIGQVIDEEGISVYSAAERMGICASQATLEADPSCDLSLSALYRWQAALEVPVAHLLTEPTLSLAPIMSLRSNLLEAMRTARALQLHVDDDHGQVLAISLAQRLIEMMAELTDISCWHASGRR